MSLGLTTRRSLLSDGSLGLLKAGALVAAGSAATAGSALDDSAGQGAAMAGMEGPLSAKAFGAIADGQRHPLSERFASLAEARRVYPFARSLDQTLDWAAIQAAVNAVEGRADRRVHLPAGRYINSDSIRLPNIIDIAGDAPGLTIIDNQNIPLDAPQFVNAEPSFVGVAIRQMSLHGGTHALKVDVPQGEIAWVTMEGVSCALQSDKNVECDRLLQSSEFRNCGFALSPYGVFVADRTTNAVTFRNCSFEQHSRTHLHLKSAEAVTFYGGKFEGGGNTPNPAGEERVTLYLENAGAVTFHGVYFESTHEILLRDVGQRSGVSFEGCRFTGADVGNGHIPYRFISDGIVHFGTNDWYQPSDGPARLFLTGFNGQKLAAGGTGVEILSRSPRQQQSVSAVARVAAGALPLVSVARIGTLAEGPLVLTGELIVHGTVRRRTGGTALLSRRYHIRIAASADGSFQNRIEMVSALDDPGIELDVQLRNQADGSALEAVLRAADEAALQWSFDSMSTTEGDAWLNVDIPPGR